MSSSWSILCKPTPIQSSSFNIVSQRIWRRPPTLLRFPHALSDYSLLHLSAFLGTCPAQCHFNIARRPQCLSLDQVLILWSFTDTPGSPFDSSLVDFHFSVMAFVNVSAPYVVIGKIHWLYRSRFSWKRNHLVNSEYKTLYMLNMYAEIYLVYTLYTYIC